MKKIFFYLLLVFSVSLLSQETDSKKLVELVFQEKPSSVGGVHEIFKKSRKNKDAIELLIKTSEEKNYLEGKLYGYNALGRIFRDYSLFKESLETYAIALKLAEENNNVDSEIKTLNSIGSVYRRQEDIQNALDYHQKALSKAFSVKNPSLAIRKSISISQNSKGNIYISLKQFDLALKEFEKSIIFQKELNDNLGLAINHQNIGNSYEELGNIDKALENYKLSLKHNILEKSEVGKIICGYSIANVLIKKGLYKDALKTVDTVLNNAIKLKDMYYLSNTYNTLGLAQVYNNKFKDSNYNLKKALNIANEFNVQVVKVKANENLALLYDKTEDYEKAYKHYKAAKEEDAKTLNNRNLLYVSELTTRYDKERTENRIKDLAKQNEIAQLEIDSNRNFFIILIILLALLTVIGYSIIKQRSLLNEKKLLSLKQEALQSQMNPHFIFNALNSIKLYIINNEQKNAVRYLNKFAKLIRKILDASKVKEISLREELETMDLYMTIENIRFNNEINYSFKVDKNINQDSIKIPPLILQPFLENSVWHGLSSKKGPKEVNLSVKKLSDGFVQFIIEDNGIGRDASAKIKANKKINKKSIGIDLTIERLKNFAKDFEKSSSLKYFDLKNDKNTSKGTVVSIRIPLV